MRFDDLEERVSRLEVEVAALRNVILGEGNSTPWWELICGSFENDPVYKQAMNLGKQYRDSLKPTKRNRDKR